MASKEAEILYKALKARKIAALIDNFDGEREVDLSIPEAKIHVEIEDMKCEPQIDSTIEEVKSMYNEYLNGFFTLKVPVSLIDNNLNEIADMIVELIEERDRLRQEEERLLDEEEDDELEAMGI